MSDPKPAKEEKNASATPSHRHCNRTMILDKTVPQVLLLFSDTTVAVPASVFDGKVELLNTYKAYVERMKANPKQVTISEYMMGVSAAADHKATTTDQSGEDEKAPTAVEDTSPLPGITMAELNAHFAMLTLARYGCVMHHSNFVGLTIVHAFPVA